MPTALCESQRVQLEDIVMALGELVNEETGQISGVRVISADATGTTSEVSLRAEGTIRGTRQVTNWTYEQIQRPDGSLYGYGRGVMTTANGDVVNLTGSGSAKVPTGLSFSRRIESNGPGSIPASRAILLPKTPHAARALSALDVAYPLHTRHDKKTLTLQALVSYKRLIVREREP